MTLGSRILYWIFSFFKSRIKVPEVCVLTSCDPMDCSPPGSCVHGLIQARTLEWVAMPSSRGSSHPRDWSQVSLISSRLFTVWATREAHSYLLNMFKLYFHTDSILLLQLIPLVIVFSLSISSNTDQPSRPSSAEPSSQSNQQLSQRILISSSLE